MSETDQSENSKLPVIQNSETNGSYIIENPEYYYHSQRKTLDERLKQVNITEEQRQKIGEKHGGKVIRDAVLGSFLIGKAAKAFVDFHEGVDKEIKDAKRAYLLEQYFNQTEDNSQAVARLRDLVSDPRGSVIFNKIMHIMDDNPPDMEQFEHLGAALKYICESDFKSLFSEHKYALSQIDQMTPQALTILADNKSWPALSIGSTNTVGGRLTSDYNDEFALGYAGTKKVSDKKMVDRLKHSVSELINRRFVEAYKHSDELIYCSVTEVGRSILPYISNKFAA